MTLVQAWYVQVRAAREYNTKTRILWIGREVGCVVTPDTVIYQAPILHERKKSLDK